MGAVVSNPAAYSVRGAPELLAPVLRIIHRVIAAYLLKQAGLKRTTADTGAVTLHLRSRASARSKLLSPPGREAGSEGAGAA